MKRREQIIDFAENTLKLEKDSIEWVKFIQGATWADENPDLYSVTRKAVEREKEYLIKKACEWLRRTQPQVIFPDTTIERFKKAMEEQQ